MTDKTEQAISELGFGQYQEKRKTKHPQPETPKVYQDRDLFQTPNYAVDLLIPFIPKHIRTIWECASGEGKISRRLEYYGYEVVSTDLRTGTDFFLASTREDAIITNPPFSLKQRFYSKCMEYDVPFALLIPADYSGWIIKACQYGAEKIIPTRRIDYITPSGLSGASGHTADFHSMWLTWGFGLGKTETFVELSIEDKKGNI